MLKSRKGSVNNTCIVLLEKPWVLAFILPTKNIVVDGAHPDRNTLPLQNNAPHCIIETTQECFEEFDKDITL